MLSKQVVKNFEEALKLHINYTGVSSNGTYLKIMDRLASGYQGSLSEKVSYLFEDYYKTINKLEGSNINSLASAIDRLKDRELESKNKDIKENIDVFNDFDR